MKRFFLMCLELIGFCLIGMISIGAPFSQADAQESAFVTGPAGTGQAQETQSFRDAGFERSGETQESSQDLRDLSIEELMEIEVQMVFSASRYRQKVSEAPASITIITVEEIRKYGYRTLADILRSVRGFYTTYDRNYDYIGIRGFGKLGDYNTRILLLVDGHRINDAIYDSAAIGTEFPLDVDLIERVEITRGPGSSLYGSNAFFGVVNIITRSADDIGGKEASTEAASNDTYKARFSYGKTRESGRSVVASASVYSSGGDRIYFHEFDPQYSLSDPRAANGGTADAADYDRSRGGFLRYERGGLRLSAVYHERTKGIPTAAFGTDFNDSGNRTVDERSYFDIQYGAGILRSAEYFVRAYYDHYQYTGDYLYSGTLNKDRAVGDWFGGEARITARLLNFNRIIAGVEYEIRQKQEQWNADIDATGTIYLDDHHGSRTWATYFQDEITVSPIFLLYAGLRFDYVSTFGGTTNPRIAAVITPIKHGTLKLLYGKAFRAPTVFEMFYGVDPQASNPHLKPEEIETYELVYEHDLGRGLRTTISRYSYNIQNLIAQTYDPNTATSSYQNQERATAVGTELEVQRTWKNGADCRISYAHQVAKDPNTAETLVNSPKDLAKLGVILPVIQERVWAGIEEQYTGSRITLAGRRTASYTTTNLTLSAKNRYGNLETSIGIYNLLNKRYADPVSIDLFPLDTVQQDGRTMRVKVTYVF